MATATEDPTATDAAKLADLEDAQEALNYLLNHEGAQDALTTAQASELGRLRTLVSQAIAALKKNIGDAQDIQDIVYEMIAAWDAYDDAPTADNRKALAQALVNYLNRETDMTDAQKAEAELAKLRAAAVIDGLTRPTAVKNADGKFNMAYTAIQAEYREATALQPAEIAAYDLLNPNADLQELVDEVKADYAEATEIMGYVKELEDAADLYAANQTSDAAEQALRNAYTTIVEKKLHSEPIKTLIGGNGSGPAWNAYADAYNAAAALFTADDNAKLADAKDAIEDYDNAWTDIIGEDMDAEDIKDAIVDQVEAVLAAENISGVTVTISSIQDVPAVGANDETWFQLYLTAGNGTPLYVDGQHVKVTNNYSAASVKAAVEAALSSKRADADSYGLDTLATYVSNQIKTVNGVTDVEVTPDGNPSPWAANTMVYYNYEYTYGGETYTGSTYFKLV